MAAIWPILVGAIVTGIVGNFLVQRWQLGVWRAQQRQLGYQAELEELKKLLEEISTKSADRHNAMRRLIGSLAPNSSQDSNEALTTYREQLFIWNGALNSIYLRIRLAVDYSRTLRFEREVHQRFYHAGQSIEQVLRERASGASPNWSDLIEPKARLNSVQAATYAFLRDLTDIVEHRREEIYFGRRLPYSESSLGEYSFLDLVKALFVSRVDRFYVIRPS
ncbi:MULTISPECIES: hypothetical protein [Inquilinus]|uniref:Uncharacterized membrane-anchored protein YhcB (DUF1043 family) n=1 Tax=Inquilinus ginsengisoli TaxID=363840 RepID=A0ABU1JIM0_9PROT|nr:hypothetical protein [Inquilinus ginsengisoli]MDR6288451.1 uncharacterized membrane-anchored protein YhcB (DUF1043 family) [Inquilinus ginsengisoli]